MRNSKTDCSFSLQDDFLRVGLPQRHEKSPKRFVERLTDAVRYAAKWLKSSTMKLSDKSLCHHLATAFGGTKGAETALLDPFWVPLRAHNEALLELSDSLSRNCLKILRHGPAASPSSVSSPRR